MRYCLELSEELKQQAELAGHDRDMTLSNWIRQAMYAYLRTAGKKKAEYEAKKWASGYPKGAKCFHCKTACHDPAEHHGYLPEEIGSTELQYAASHKCD